MSRKAGLLGLGVFAIVSLFAQAAQSDDIWELLTFQDRAWTWRANVPGGWLVKVEKEDQIEIEYFPDASHAWQPMKNSQLDYIAARYLKLTENQPCPGVCQNPPRITRFVSVGDIAAFEPVAQPSDGLTSSVITLTSGKEIKVSEDVNQIRLLIAD